MPDKRFADKRMVRIWLEKVSKLMLQKYSSTNTYPVFRWAYRHTPLFGNCTMFFQDDPEDLFRLYPYPVGRFSIDINHKDEVDTVAVSIKRTVKQLVSRFGLDSIRENAPKIAEQYDRGELVTQIDVHVLVEPNDSREELQDIWGRPWRSVWWTKDGEILGTGGFDQFPALVPRWETDPGMLYGTGIGHYSLSDAGMLMAAEKDHNLILSKLARPPMQGAGMQGSEVKDFPGGWTNTPGMAGGQAISPLYQSDPRSLDAAREAIAKSANAIDELWHVDLFRMLINRPISNATATEIAERGEERLLQVGPVLQSYERGMLTPFVQHVFRRMVEEGELPPPPPEAQGMPLTINYVSPLARAQKIIGIQAGERYLATIGNLSGALPQVLDNLDGDAISRGYAEQLGVKPDWLRGQDAVNAERQTRARQQQQQAMAEQGLANAQGAKLLSETQVTDDRTMLQVLGQQ